jgi:hypothetical protein
MPGQLLNPDRTRVDGLGIANGRLQEGSVGIQGCQAAMVDGVLVDLATRLKDCSHDPQRLAAEGSLSTT